MAASPNPVVLWALRIGLIAGLALALRREEYIQVYVDRLWDYVRSTWVFNSVYFETWYVTVTLTVLLVIPSLMDSIRYFDAYKMDKHASYDHPTYKQVAQESLVHLLPFMAVDTFHVKGYAGVAESVLIAKRKSLIQRTRALPDATVPFSQILWHIAVSIVIYDAVFFVLHFILHKNAVLYKHLHAEHHDHKEGLQGRVTNKLTVGERVTLVLSANSGLKMVGAHPLTRMLFVPVFLWMLIENHWNYDFPYSYEKIFPAGLMGGSRYHHAHHCQGSRNYQPFFTYLDRALVVFGRRRKLKEL